MISAFKKDPVTQELLHTFKGSRVSKINGTNVNITVDDLEDDLEAIYAVDNSKKAQEFRKQLRQNQLFVDKFLKQKKLKE